MSDTGTPGIKEELLTVLIFAAQQAAEALSSGDREEAMHWLSDLHSYGEICMRRVSALLECEDL